MSEYWAALKAKFPNAGKSFKGYTQAERLKFAEMKRKARGH